MKSTTKFSNKQIADRESGRAKIIRALAAGRHLTFLDAREFGIAEFNTAICLIRKDVESGKIPFRLRQIQTEFAPKKYCQEYWFEKPKKSRR